MRYVKWTFFVVIALIVIGFFHYTLPQRDIVRIVNTYEERQDFGGFKDLFWQNTGSATSDAPITRDVLYIQAVRPNGDPAVFRNQDTGWGWPPYFKFDTANLQTRAADAVSTGASPRWFAVRHYGWRVTWIGDGIFPNALSIKEVEGPDVTLIPYFNIVFFVLLAALLMFIRSRWLRFRHRRIDPVVDEIEADWDEAEERVGGFFDRIFGRKK